MASLLSTSCIIQGHFAWFISWPYDAQCLFDDFIGNVGGEPRYWMIVNLILIGCSYPLSIVTLYERPTKLITECLVRVPRGFLQNRVWRLQDRRVELYGRSFADIGAEVLYCVSLEAFWTAVRLGHLALVALITARRTTYVQDIFWLAYSLQGLVGDRTIPASEMDGTENVMSFGQIVPMLLLTSTVFVFGEAYVGESLDGRWVGPAKQ